jgi:hypothetical protein
MMIAKRRRQRRSREADNFRAAAFSAEERAGGDALVASGD